MNSSAPDIGGRFELVPVSKLSKHPRADFLHIRQELLGLMSENMRKDGYDASKPISAWEKDGQMYIVDGRTRQDAASMAGIKEIPVCMVSFDSEDGFIEAAVHAQTLRRQTNTGDALQIIETLWPIKAAQAKKRQAHKANSSSRDLESPLVEGSETGQVRDILAKELGLSASTIDRLKKISDYSRKHGTAHRDDIASEQRSNIREVYEEILALEKAAACSMRQEIAPNSEQANQPDSLPAHVECSALAAESAHHDLPENEAAGEKRKINPKGLSHRGKVGLDIFRAVLALVPKEEITSLRDLVLTAAKPAKDALAARIAELESGCVATEEQ
ncbi:MAG: hypothetical protein A2X49_01500 [Lentisphaerae bacterium GWF2_52_8]|nr:MAG: hypothetical protein A2X49_01500 [Lentisphaerae bacterium GWF2_52_8]